MKWLIFQRPSITSEQRYGDANEKLRRSVAVRWIGRLSDLLEDKMKEIIKKIKQQWRIRALRKKNYNDIKSNHTIGGIWGNHMQWFSPEQFNSRTINTRLDIYGHKPAKQYPKEGDIVEGEFGKSCQKFMVIEVQHIPNPPDMFFGKVVYVSGIKR